MAMQGDTTSSNSATPPTVSAGSNQTITLPTSSTTLAGSANANSPATSISSYSWSQVSGPNSASFNATTIATPIISGLIAGVYTEKLTVVDNNGNTNNASVNITVNSATNSCKAYYWDSTNTNILLNSANFPLVAPCDTIYVDSSHTAGGYRSLTIKLTAATQWKYSTLDSNRINIIFRNGSTYGTIKPNATGNMFANGIDSSNNLLIQGLKMYDHTDPLFSTVTQTGYLHHIKFYKDTLQNIPGIWGSGPISTTLPNFTGNNDTINCNYDLIFRDCRFDTTGNTSFGGLSVLWLGGLLANQVFVRTTIDSCYFNYAPSPAGSGAACFIHCQQCIGIEIEHNIFKNLGVVANPQGHAASILIQFINV